MNKGVVFDIQRSSFVDGPGIRTTVFFKGCNLKCKWCHNPESQRFEPQIMFYKDKCTGCGRCKGITPENSDFICFNDAKKICGREYGVDEIFKEIIKDKPFYDSCGGGVTFSGGECMLQTEFLEELMKRCKNSGINTAVDTAGNVSWDAFERVLPYTDLFLYDIKVFDDEVHKKYTGASNKLILNNLTKLFEKNANVHIRIPVIPGVNDNAEEMRNIKRFLSAYKPVKVELLPYHKMGEYKYEALNMQAVKFDVPSEDILNELKSSLKE